MTPEATPGRVEGHETCHHLSYRISCEDFDAMLKRADGRCEICRIPAREATRGKLFIDHDHNYGVFAIRGLICNRCNLLARKVEQGEVADIRVTTYFANAWFMWRLVNPPGSQGTPRDPRVFGGWERSAQALRKAGLWP